MRMARGQRKVTFINIYINKHISYKCNIISLLKLVSFTGGVLFPIHMIFNSYDLFMTYKNYVTIYVYSHIYLPHIITYMYASI